MKVVTIKSKQITKIKLIYWKTTKNVFLTIILNVILICLPKKNNNSNFVFSGDFQALFDAAYPNSSAYRVSLYDVSTTLLAILNPSLSICSTV